ncbi:hypothetical protein ACIQM0_08740 [Streptomyces sp. NPDC091387]|uniref:hypothetical protein n=1 Tax=Streptomyces sp. NPDC091387 TaxID=3365998 RepID=UPI0037F8621E
MTPDTEAPPEMNFYDVGVQGDPRVLTTLVGLLDTPTPTSPSSRRDHRCPAAAPAAGLRTPRRPEAETGSPGRPPAG